MKLLRTWLAMKHRVILLGNRALAKNILDFLTAQESIELLVVLNPQDHGNDGSGISLHDHIKNTKINYIQPTLLKNELEFIEKFNPTLALSCSYSRIIPECFINLVPHVLNIHFADLPKNRGCLPVIWTLYNREEYLTATLHEVVKALDAGPIVAKKQQKLASKMTAKQAYDVCVDLGAQLFMEFWDEYKVSKKYHAIAQQETVATYHSMVFPQNRWIKWEESSEAVINFINCLTNPPHPSARTQLGETEIEILGPCIPAKNVKNMQAGQIKIIDNTIFIGTADDVISIQSIVMNNKPILEKELLYFHNKKFNKQISNKMMEIIK